MSDALKVTKRPTFRRVLLTGVVIITPVFITFSVIRFILTQIDHAVTPAILQVLRWVGLGGQLDHGIVDWMAPVVSVGVLVLITYIVGLVGGNVIGRQLLAGIERLLLTIPMVRGIYSATRQFLDTFSSDKKAFSRVVLVEYPRAGSWTVGFETNRGIRDIDASTGHPMVAVFVPTTPNPTSGFLLFFPADAVRLLDLSVDDGFKMIVSGGVLVPGQAPRTRKLPVDETTGAHRLPSPADE